NPPSNPSRTSTALLSRNLPSPRPTDSSFTLTTFTDRGTAITGLRVSQLTYSANGATFWSTGCRSSQTVEYLLCTIRPTTFEANTRGSSLGLLVPQPAATTTTAARRTASRVTPSRSASRRPRPTPPASRPPAARGSGRRAPGLAPRA